MEEKTHQLIYRASLTAVWLCTVFLIAVIIICLLFLAGII